MNTVGAKTQPGEWKSLGLRGLRYSKRAEVSLFVSIFFSVLFAVFFLGSSGVVWAEDENGRSPDPKVRTIPERRSASSPIVMSKTNEGLRYATLKDPGENMFVKNRDGAWIAAKDGMVILPGDEVRTLSESEVKKLSEIGKIGRIEINEGSFFKIEEAETAPAPDDKAPLVSLAVGKTLMKAEAMKGQSRAAGPVTQSTTARA